MKLPKRISTHIKESDAWKILLTQVPPEWIVREVSERDYGIDCYIELVNKEAEVTGDLLSIQLKGSQNLRWKSEGNKEFVSYSGIRIETINYWMSLPVPVFLFLADLSERTVYFCSVKEQVREQYTKFTEQKSLTFHLRKDFKLGKEEGRKILLYLYYREKHYKEFVMYLSMLLSHFDSYMDFIRFNQNLDFFLELEPDAELLFVHLYDCCFFLSMMFSIKWDIQSLDKIYIQQKNRYGIPSTLHNEVLTEILPLLQTKLQVIINGAKVLILEEEKEFWSFNYPILYKNFYRFDSYHQGIWETY